MKATVGSLSRLWFEAARKRGYEYVAITDHSAGRGIANGLSEERLRIHIANVRALDASLPDIRVLTGSEVDIRADGSLDYPDEILAELDVVVASVHSARGQERDRMTERVIRAMRKSPREHRRAPDHAASGREGSQ